MLSDQMHFLIESLDACHVSFRVVCKLDLLSATDTFGAPVEISHIDRTTDLSCYCVKSCLPSLDRLACTFRSKSQMNNLPAFHLVYYAYGYIAASLSVYRYAAKLSEKPPERAPEEFPFDHTVWFASYRCIIKV